ncbi:Tricorn protease-interacting factor F3 [Aphelenchoides fujianensis]|nr:Tricorn protease-interacting factor F3 [Aphelenchoides fujianensis]
MGASTADFLHLLDAITDEEVRTFEVAGREDILSVNETLPPTNSVRPSAFLNAWLRQGSHPIVFIAYDKSVHQFVFTQKPKLHTRSARSRRVQWPIPVWIDCAAGSVPERLFWLLPGRELVLRLSDLTLTNDSNAVAFNRNRSVYLRDLLPVLIAFRSPLRFLPSR